MGLGNVVAVWSLGMQLPVAQCLVQASQLGIRALVCIYLVLDN